MDIQFINITSYIGVSSNAEHFYARVGAPKCTQENYVTMIDCDMASGVNFPSEGELRFFPDAKQAEALWKKDYGYETEKSPLNRKDDIVAELQEDGTIRFPSVVEIIKTARKRFPDSLLCLSMNGSRKEFAKYVFRMDKGAPGFAEMIATLVMNE